MAKQIPESDIDFHPDTLCAGDIERGVCRLFTHMGYAPLTEFPLTNNRRVDVIGLAKDGNWIVAEIKASERDFRSDGKWPEYLPYCHEFYFAVAGGFPLEILPHHTGIIVADAFHGAVLRKAPRMKMNAARWRAQALHFGRKAAGRWHGLVDPKH